MKQVLITLFVGLVALATASCGKDHTADLRRIEDQLIANQARLRAIEERIGNLENNALAAAHLTERVERLERDTESVTKNAATIGELAGRIDSMGDSVDDAADVNMELAAVEERLTNLERRVTMDAAARGYSGTPIYRVDATGEELAIVADMVACFIKESIGITPDDPSYPYVVGHTEQWIWRTLESGMYNSIDDLQFETYILCGAPAGE